MIETTLDDMLKLVLKNISSRGKFFLLVISITELQMNVILYLLIVGLTILTC